jgi:LPXTG-motif cell wall-anchored protein
MITVGGLHRWALTIATALPIFGVMSGSPLLEICGGLLVIVLLVRGSQSYALTRPKTLAIAIHSLTVVLLIFCFILFPRARIDAVLLVVMLGIFNRWILRAGQRDDLIILGAAAVLLAAATTITPGIAFAAIMFGYVIFALWAALGAVILSLAEREASLDARRAAWQRMSRRPIGKPLSSIAASSILFTLIGASLMVFFPRYQFTRFLGAGYFMALAGQPDEMELRTGGVIGPQDGRVAMRIEPTPGRASGSIEGMYAQIGVLDEFDGRSWKSRVERPRREFYLYTPQDLYRGPKEAFAPEVDGPNTLRVTLFRRTPRDQPHPIATMGFTRPGFVMMFSIRQQENGSLIVGPNWPGNQLVYKIDPDRGPSTMALPDENERTLQLPKLDARVVQLAEDLTRGLTNDREKVEAILAYFSKARFTYSLEPLSGTSDDPLVRFLFEAKRGHCELYAGALAVLLRASKVKARVAAGYYGGRWNSVGGYLELGDADAHAWVEAFYDGAWRWVDATPQDLRARREEQTLAWILDAYDALETFWFNRVLDFDERKRKELVGDLGKTFEAFAGGGWFEDGGSSKLQSGSASQLAIPLVAIALLAGGAFLVVRRRRRSPEALGRRLRRALGHEGNLTLRRVLAGIESDRLALATSAVSAYEHLRFGAPEDAPDPAHVLSAIRALERRRPASQSRTRAPLSSPKS